MKVQPGEQPSASAILRNRALLQEAAFDVVDVEALTDPDEVFEWRAYIGAKLSIDWGASPQTAAVAVGALERYVEVERRRPLRLGGQQ